MKELVLQNRMVSHIEVISQISLLGESDIASRQVSPLSGKMKAFFALGANE